MDTKCIFDKNKLCDNCGDCRCDLDNKKICNNCGKCLEIDGYDIRAIRIDEIIDSEEEETALSESLEPLNGEIKVNNMDNDDLKIDFENKMKIMDEIDKDDVYKDDVDKEDVTIEFIDDIPELSEIIEDEDKRKSMSHEIFPGLIKLDIKE